MPDTKNKATSLIIGKGLLTAEAIAQELRQRLTRELAKSYRYITHPELLEIARNILREFEPILAENLHATDLAAWLEGYDTVSKKLPPYLLDAFGRNIGGPTKPPGGLILPSFGDDGDEPIVSFPMIEKAAERLAEKRILSKQEFDAASAAAKARSFTVAGDLSDDTIEAIRDVLSETVDEGASLEGFRRNLGERLERSFLGPAHLETVYRTNIQSAFHDGHDALADNPVVQDVFPYQAYLAITDARARKNHLALETLGIDGTNIYRRADIAFWSLFTPAWDYNCRCGVNLMTIEAAARAGVQEAVDWLRTGVRPPLRSRLAAIPFRPPAGFGARRVAA